MRYLRLLKLALPGKEQNIIELLIEKTEETLPAIKRIRLLDPENNCLRMKEKLQSFNNLRVLLSFLLDRGEAILFHRLSSVVKVISLDIRNQKFVIDLDRRNNPDLIEQIKNDLERATGVVWSFTVKHSSDSVTYGEFLNTLDKHHEKALLQSDIVKYILSKFDGLKIEKIILNNKDNNHIN